MDVGFQRTSAPEHAVGGGLFSSVFQRRQRTRYRFQRFPLGRHASDHLGEWRLETQKRRTQQPPRKRRRASQLQSARQIETGAPTPPRAVRPRKKRPWRAREFPPEISLTKKIISSRRQKTKKKITVRDNRLDSDFLFCVRRGRRRLFDGVRDFSGGNSRARHRLFLRGRHCDRRGGSAVPIWRA